MGGFFMNYFKIGQKIRKYRKAKGMSQEYLAEKAGISVTHMSHIETGNTKLSLPVFVDIARALNIQTDDLLTDEYAGKTIVTKELEEVLINCSAQEVRIILDIVRSLKIALDTYL